MEDKKGQVTVLREPQVKIFLVLYEYPSLHICGHEMMRLF